MATGGTTGSISFGGLVSGLDTKGIVEKLVEVKKQQLLAPLERRIDELDVQKKALAPIKQVFNSFLAQARRANDIVNNIFNSKGGTSSDTDTVLLTSVTSAKAVVGTYVISDITQLAQADRVIFNGVANQDTTTFGTGTFDITYKGSTTSIEIDSTNNTLEGIVSAINSVDAGVTASIINDGDATNPYRLVLTSEDTGADTAITHDINVILPALTVDAVASADPLNEPESAIFEINGIANTSASNTITNAIQGVTFSLLEEAPAASVTLTISKDTATMVSRITDFVSSYNEVRINLQAALLPDENGNLGPLGSDTTLTTANVKIASIMGSVFNTFINDSYNTLAEIGVKTDTSGLMKVDSAKLKAALESDTDNVQRIFQGNSQEDGIAEQMQNYVNGLLNPIGVFARKEQNMKGAVKTIEEQVDFRQGIIEEYEARLNRRYNRLEQVLSQLKSQEAAVASFAGIYTNSSNNLL